MQNFFQSFHFLICFKQSKIIYIHNTTQTSSQTPKLFQQSSILFIFIFSFFYMLVLLRRTSFLTTLYGLYFSHHYILHITNCLLVLRGQLPYYWKMSCIFIRPLHCLKISVIYTFNIICVKGRAGGVRKTYKPPPPPIFYY